ncbi:MAG: thioredoxin [Gemmatimonadetes bacterium]|nr:thioredoxin [Gemmatimonadota bacterium]
MANQLAVTDATFATEIEGHAGVAMVDFWAEWCGPCKMIAPLVEQLATEFDGKVKVRKLDVDENGATMQKYNVRSIPAILFFKDGKVVDQVVGAFPAKIQEKIRQHAAAALVA